MYFLCSFYGVSKTCYNYLSVGHRHWQISRLFDLTNWSNIGNSQLQVWNCRIIRKKKKYVLVFTHLKSKIGKSHETLKFAV